MIRPSRLPEAETGGRNGTFGSTLRQLSAGPAGAGIGLVVLSTRAGIVRLRELANRLQGTRTLIAVLPAPVRETTPDDAEEYVDGVARALPGTPVGVVAGGSAAGYLAARLAEARAAQQADPPTLVMLEPPLPDDMMRIPLATLLRLPEVVLQRFEQLLGVDSLSQAAWDTPEFRRDVMAAFRDRRADLEAAIHSVDRAQRLVAPELPMDLYTEWAGSVSYCMQLRKATYAGPTVCVEGRMSAELAEAVRQRRFAEISRAFPRASFHRTDVEHAELLTDAVLHRYFAVS